MTDTSTNAPADLPALDWMAALTAAACAVHCAVLPLAIAAVPAVGAAWLADERLGDAAMMLSVLLALLALTRGCLRHRSARPAVVAAAGFGALVVAEAALESSLLGGVVLGGSGGLLVAGAHLLNRSLCLSCRACRLSDGVKAGPCRGEEP